MAHKLFIGGLSFSTTSERLRELFAQAGSVESTAVVTDQTGRSRGFGFVEMSTSEDADKAIAQFNGQDVDGRRLKVERAKAPGAGGGGPRSGSDRGGSGRGRW
ncbi:MAG TPA: RNA-binding protein [Methylomirabilota bacterium]|nr:RNA-binding protein [Methylomirabilota bacterium]